MSLYKIEESSLVAIGDAIREKTGETFSFTPAQMAEKILSISTSSGEGSGLTNGNFYTEMIQYAGTTQGAYAPLLTNNAFAQQYWNDPTFFIVLFGLQVPTITDTSSLGGSAYQWVTACACNSPVIASSDGSETWYGFGVYHMLGKGYTYPSTLYIPYSNLDASNTNYSGFNVTQEGNVSMWLCNYDVLGPGVYRILLGTLM